MVKRIFRQILRLWNLERKFLLFFGSALLISLVLAFAAVQNVAARLVMETTRQAARDFATATYVLKHLEFMTAYSTTSGIAPANRNADHLKFLRNEMMNSRYNYEVLRLSEGPDFDSLPGSQPTSDFERKLLESIQQKQVAEMAALLKNVNVVETPPPAEAGDGKSLDQPYDLGAPDNRDIFAEAGPIQNMYYYYHPVTFKKFCYECHPANPQLAKGEEPFRVIRVGMPYNSIRLWTMWSLSIMLAIALATLGLTLFIFHWILKRLVIRPLGHLHDVSDDISRGQIDRRAELDTDDEFHELAEAFNRMLRHLTESEMQIRSVNTELDRRVDQLAQANLQLYEANRLKSEFLANMSHELRTPLNSILGFSEVLQKFDSLTDKQKRYAGNIQKSGRLLLDMINDILDLAKVEAGKMQVRPSHFDLGVMVRGQCEIVRKLAEDKNIDLRIENELHSIQVYQDQAKTQQILTNLLSNAIKFTPEGGFITVTMGESSEGTFSVAVADSGVGIAECDFEIIFEKFRQARLPQGGDDLAREFTGTGLGLSIVRELCKLLGGEVMLSSQLGQGSTFRIDLPVHYSAGFTSNIEPSLLTEAVDSSILTDSATMLGPNPSARLPGGST